MVHLSFLNEVETLISAQVLGQIDTFEVSLVKHVDHEVAQRDEVISSASNLEVELVKTGKDHVTSEGLNLLRLDVLSVLLIDVP